MMLNTLRELNDYSNFLPKKIKENVNKEKYEILCEIKKIVSLKKNNSYNVTLVIKLYNLYETINTTKHKSFHFYIFMIKYLWYSLHNKNISPNLKSYICQTISGILENIKNHILDDYFFEYDKELIFKDEESSTFVQPEDVSGTWHDEGNGSDVTNNSYEGISDHYYDEYKYINENPSDVDSTTINENKPHMPADRYYLSINGIFERGDENSSSFFNEEVLINGKDEGFRLYIQKCIFSIIDYKYLFSLFYNYLSNNSKKQDGYSHNAYKNFITSVINLLAMLRPFCYYNIDVHNLLFNFSLNNIFSSKYEEYVDMRGDFLLECANRVGECAQEMNQSDATDGNHDDNNCVNEGKDKHGGGRDDCSIFAINFEMNKRTNTGVVLDDNYMKHKLGEGGNAFIGMIDESVLRNVDLATYPIEKLEICPRYNTVFLNFVILSQLGSDDLCFKLIKYEKALHLYRKLRRYNWHSINYAFVRIVYKGLKYAYMYNISLEKQMKEIVRLLFFLFLYYIKLPCNVQLSSAKKYIPDDYNLLINDDDSVVKTISKTFVFLLNKMYRKVKVTGGNSAEEVKQKQLEAKMREKELLQAFLSLLNDENFNLSVFDEVTNDGEGQEGDGGKGNKRKISSLFHDLDTHEFFNIITCLFMPHIHPSSVGKHLGNINLFINTFLFSFIRKLKRESLYLKRMKVRRKTPKNDNLMGGGNVYSEVSINLHDEADDYVSKYFISEEEKKFVMEKFTQLAVQGMFPKGNKGVSLFENILKHICVVDINCLDIFVKKMLECLINVNTSTQICNCLLSLCLILPLLIRYKAGHLKELLSVMIMGIDICDVYKSFTIFSFLSILFSYICIVKIENVGGGKGVDLKIAIREYTKFMQMEGSQAYTLHLLNDEQIEEVMKERKELVDYLCYWIHEFFDKILYFIKFTKNEKSKDSKKMNGEKKENKVGNDIYTGLKTTLISLFIHLDHDILYELCEKFLNNIDQENAKSLSIIPLAFGMVNNKKIYDMLFNAFYKKLITKRKKKRLVHAVTSSDGAVSTQEEEEYFTYSKNEYANDDTVKCYLHFLSNLIRRARNEYINLEDIYNLIEIYIIEDNNVAFKYICKIMYRFLEINFSLSVKEYACFKIEENISAQEKIRTLAGWGIPWYILNNAKNDGNVLPNKTCEQEQVMHTTQNYEEGLTKGDCINGRFSDGAQFNADEMIKWKMPSRENVKVGKRFMYILLDYLLDLIIQCGVPVSTPNLIKYVEKRKLREKKIQWKFPLNHSNVISRIYKIIKCIVKPLSCLYPDERYNYNNLLVKCHVVNTKLSFYLYVYLCEIVVTLSLHVLKIPKQILSMSLYAKYNPNDDRLEHRSSFSSVNSENSVNDVSVKQILVDKNELKKLKEDFFTNIINNREESIKADAKMQRKIIKSIHFLLLKCNDSPNTTMYNEYINSVLSFTYNIYPYSYNYDIIKSQYVNNILSLYNERLKQRKKNYCFKGYREQLCNILFFTNLSIYSQVRSYAQSTTKLVLPTFKIIKIPFLKICSFYLKNYIKLYILMKSEQNKEPYTESTADIGISNATHAAINNSTNGPMNEPISDPTNSGSLTKLSTLKSLGELNNHDYFENKCISCFNGILINISSNSGLIKKISTDLNLLRKYIKIILNILRLEIQKDEVTLKCMKLVYAIINSRFIKNQEASTVGEEKKKKKSERIIFISKGRERKEE